MAIIQGFTIAFLVGIVACIHDECPPSESLRGCHCGFAAGRIVMECIGKKSGKTIEQFRNMLQDNKLQSKALELTFMTQRASNLSSRIFDGFDIKALSFQSSLVSRWADEVGGPAFVGLEDSLEKLTIDNSIRIFDRKDRVTAMTLGHLRKLRVVRFRKNYMHNFYNDWFGDGGSSVAELQLDDSNVYTLGDRAFAGLTNLEHFVLIGNDLDTLNRSIFPNPATHLRSLNLWNNRLLSLPEDMFTNMPSLVEVNVGRNHLTHLPESTWRPVWSQLRSLDVTDIYAECDDETLQWIFEERIPEILIGTCVDYDNRIDVELRDLFEKKQKEVN